ncbi:MAG: hypothetical protein OSA23_03085, partial [Rhodospirillales bacterium]|nr:hypothetical protein [Rhodospirillales bacterium]
NFGHLNRPGLLSALACDYVTDYLVAYVVLIALACQGPRRRELLCSSLTLPIWHVDPASWKDGLSRSRFKFIGPIT